MADIHHRPNQPQKSLSRLACHDDLAARLAPKRGARPPRVRHAGSIDRSAVAARWALLDVAGPVQGALVDPVTLNSMALYQGNIENFIGTAKIPIGLAGPLRVNGMSAQGDYYVPMATTEAALVASYSRGANLITAAGGASVMVLNEGVGRTPGFAFADLIEAGRFVSWALCKVDDFRRLAEGTTRHGRLIDMSVTVEGNHVYLGFAFTTGDASGQNMVTIATNAICEWIVANSPVAPDHWFIEANMSGDKKASAQSFMTVRGRKVTAEAHLPAELIRQHLHTTPACMAEYWRMSAMGAVMSGTVGVHGHISNALAALYIATGQDAACVAESAVGVGRLEVTASGGLYATVTLPNIMVGTVGGGTGLPTQRACLEIMGLAGPGRAGALAEVCAALCLAGELSIVGALCAGHFSRAHQTLARGGRGHAAPAGVRLGQSVER